MSTALARVGRLDALAQGASSHLEMQRAESAVRGALRSVTLVGASAP
ncbi:hypothetical protein WMF37_33180 [Sorangium sp. So ce291]